MEQVWYAAYGSNLSRERFGFYLSGGQPPERVSQIGVVVLRRCQAWCARVRFRMSSR